MMNILSPVYAYTEVFNLAKKWFEPSVGSLGFANGMKRDFTVNRVDPLVSPRFRITIDSPRGPGVPCNPCSVMSLESNIS